MGATRLELAETEVEGVTVVCRTKIYNHPHSLQQKHEDFTTSLTVVNHGERCRLLEANVPPASQALLSRTYAVSAALSGMFRNINHNTAHNIATKRLNVELK
jgi:hypothetical protein